MRLNLLIALLMAPTPALSFENAPSAEDLVAISQADVVIVGETHDNSAHHELQAKIIAAISPSALVVEMLTGKQAETLSADKAAYGAIWNENGWPDYAMYLPVFAATDAPIYGAVVPRDVARASYKDGVEAHFEGDVQAFGLNQNLPKDQHDQRLELQFEAHCEAMPRVALGGMIEVQRLRDATLAKITLEAVDATGGPVVVITGNGHARADWGVPSYLELVRNQLDVVTIGQAEAGIPPNGAFDIIYDAPAVDRPDPCEAFK